MSETATADPPASFPWIELLRWQPFQIDALGLITLLGAEEVNAAVGRLIRSTWLEYLPLLGGYVIANERFREKQPGFHIYNITKGIHTTDIAAWFSRWIKAQDFHQTRSFVRWTIQKQKGRRIEQTAGICLSVSLIGFLMALTVLAYDWYGFANGLSMAASIMVRHYMVNSLREAIDQNVMTCVTGKNEPTQEDMKNFLAAPQDSHWPPSLERGWLGGNPSKVLIITSDAKAVAMLIPGELLKPPSAFIANLQPEHRLVYGLMRWSGWIAFAVQVVTIGMADLITQLFTVFLLVVPTILHVSKLGCDDSQWAATAKGLWSEMTRSKHGGVHNLKPPSPTLPTIEEPKPVEDENLPSHDQFEFKYHCWIGTYLKAEVYEWPPNHHYQANNQTSEILPATNPPSRSEKRQHLYAWLQPTKAETVSMDKWDLFPHRRGNADDEWKKCYKAGKRHVAELNRLGQGIMTPIWRARREEQRREASPTTTRSSGVTATAKPVAGTTALGGPRLRTTGSPNTARKDAVGKLAPPPQLLATAASSVQPDSVSSSAAVDSDGSDPDMLAVTGTVKRDRRASMVSVSASFISADIERREQREG